MSLTLQQALDHDEAGDNGHFKDIHQVLTDAFANSPEDTALALRVCNFLLTIAKTEAMMQTAKTAIEAAKDKDAVFVTDEFVCVIANMLIARAQLYKAGEILELAPAHTALWHEMNVAVRCWKIVDEEGGNHAVVNGRRLEENWWELPPTALPKQFNGHDLTSWAAGILSERDEENVYLNIGFVDDDGKLAYGLMTIEYDAWLERGGEETEPFTYHYSPDCPRYWEIGSYGGKTLIVATDQTSIRRPLDRPYPDLGRYLKKSSFNK